MFDVSQFAIPSHLNLIMKCYRTAQGRPILAFVYPSENVKGIMRGMGIPVKAGHHEYVAVDSQAIEGMSGLLDKTGSDWMLAPPKPFQVRIHAFVGSEILLVTIHLQEKGVMISTLLPSGEEITVAYSAAIAA